MTLPIRVPGRKAIIQSLLWLIVGTIVLFVGLYAYVLLDIKFGGRELKQFCAQSLKGKSFEEIDSLARKAGLTAKETREVILVSVPGKMGGHQCHISSKAGRASAASTIYMF